ncbi:MAG: signal peptidase II [Planctomycetota bacterium]
MTGNAPNPAPSLARIARIAPRIAGRSPRAWTLFLTITACVIAADLVVKNLSFERVAGQPLHLTASPDGPVVRYQVHTPVGPIQTTYRDVLTAYHPGAELRVPLHATPDHEPVPLVPYVLELKLVVNAGAVFGLGQGQRWLFIAASLLATGVILYLFARSPAKAWIAQAPLALILAGALGNLYDRARFGGVRDMFHLFPDVHLPFGWQWSPGVTEIYPWIWNLADASLLIGVFSVLILSWKFPQGVGHTPGRAPGNAPAPSSASAAAPAKQAKPADGDTPAE